MRKIIKFFAGLFEGFFDKLEASRKEMDEADVRTALNSFTKEN